MNFSLIFKLKSKEIKQMWPSQEMHENMKEGERMKGGAEEVRIIQSKQN